MIVALTNEPQSTRAWATGAWGEERLGAALAGVPGISVLHDRRMPGSRANIDHLLVGPGGVFVVDAKRYQGRIAIHDKGGLFSSDRRLYVGRRDCSALADGVQAQADAVRDALRSAGVDPLPPIVPILCFVDGDWPLLMLPSSFRGVRVEGTHSIKRLLAREPTLDPDSVARISRFLAEAFLVK